MASYSPVATRGNVADYSYKYKLNPDKTPGVDYFYQNNPVSREAYTLGSGKQYSDIESNYFSNFTKPTAAEAGNNNRTLGDTPSLDLTKPITATTPGSGGGGGGVVPTFQPRYFNGTLYNNEAEYNNALIGDFNKKHDQARKSVESAYQNGLISFEERKKLLDQNRENLMTNKKDLENSFQNNLGDLGRSKQQALDSQAGYFSSIAPNATQSGEKVMANQTEEQYNRGVTEATTARDRNNTAIDQGLGQIDMAVGGLGREQTQFQNDYQNNLGAIKESTQGNIDAVNNASLDFANRVQAARADNAARAAATGRANTKQYDPTEILKGLAGLAIQNQGYGLSEEQSKANVLNTLKQTGINPKEQDAILATLYGTFLPGYQKTIANTKLGVQ